jgi:hypothetical protein
MGKVSLSKAALEVGRISLLFGSQQRTVFQPSSSQFRSQGKVAVVSRA